MHSNGCCSRLRLFFSGVIHNIDTCITSQLCLLFVLVVAQTFFFWLYDGACVFVCVCGGGGGG